MRLFILFWLIILIPITTFSQNCGLADTIIIQANTNPSLDFTISDYFNDDLGDPLQGLCDIEIHFVHPLVERFEISLTSPGGQTVQLTGPNPTTTPTSTFFAQWKIHFVPCGESAAPDLGFLPQWDNEQPNDFVVGGQYSGSYYPFNGCLEDFNTGPVNGQWTFNFDNNASPNSGAIVYVRLIFCDTRGVDCCFAQAGEIEDDDILSCEGDSSLIFEPMLSGISTNATDTITYGYLYTLIQDSLIIAYDTTLNLSSYPAGNYEVCGLSYRLTELDSLPLADSTMNIDSLRNNLNGIEPWFCGEVTDSCMSIHIVAPPDTVFLENRICEGDSIMIGDTSLMTNGIHNIILENYAGCDSIVNVNLIVESIPLIALDSTICLGDSAIIGNSVYYESGLYVDTLQTTNLGCDSIVNLQLTVIQPITIDTTVTICAGDAYVVGDSTFTTAGSYSVLMASSLFCDSTINLTLSVLELTAIVSPPDTINCYHDSIFLNGTNSTPIGILTYEWFNLGGDLLGNEPLQSVSAANTVYLQVSATENMTTCSSRDTIIVIESLTPPIADAGINDTITCTEMVKTLGGSNTSIGDNISYNWQSADGNFTTPINIATPSVNGAGTYELIVTDMINGCSDTSVVIIEIDTIPPIVEAGEGFIINCNTTQEVLSGIGSATGSNINYLWTGNCIDNAPNQLDITVSCADLYFLNITNTENGCTAIDSVEVNGDTISPVAVIETPDTLTCLNEAITLDASSSTPIDSISFIWEGPGIANGENTAMPSVNVSGDYTLIITDTFNFCADTSFVNVAIDTISPIVDAGITGTLNCITPQLEIGGNNTSVGANFTYNWSSSEGHFVNNTNLATATIDSAGFYILEVTNINNGCQDGDFVIIAQNFNQPFTEAGDSTAFRCGDDIIRLDANQSIPTENSIIEWTGPCIETTTDSLIIDVSCGGTYFLSITDTESGCISEDFVEVGIDPAALFAHLPDSAFISCETGEVTLDGSMTSLGVYQWYLNGEAIDLIGRTPTVQDTGIYELVVFNLIETCLDTAAVHVFMDCDFEINLVNEPAIINCGESVSIIETTVNPLGFPYEYNWTAPAPSCITTGQNTPIINVICGGEYTLIVNNTAVGISDTLIINVEANEDVPIANAGLPDTLTCTQNSVFLNGSASSVGLEIVYNWVVFPSGDVVGNQAIIEITEPGTYILEVSDTLNNCSSFSAVQVFQDNTIPEIVFGTTVFLCESDTFALQSFVNPTDDDYVYTWSGEGIIGTDSSTVLIDTIGEFILEVLDISSGCTATDTVEISHQICLPCVDILTPAILNCATDSISLTGLFCEECVNCTVEWSTTNGLILSGTNTLSASVALPGIYELTVTDMFGFSNSASVNVIGDFHIPNVFAGSDAILTCGDTSAILGSEITDTGDEFTYSWSAFNASSTLPDDEQFTTVMAADTYILSVQNTINGCINQDTVVVTMDTIPPIADTGLDTFLSCDTPFIILDGSGSSLGNTIIYSWQAPSTGDCILGDSTLNPIISCPGIYILTVTDTLTGCQDTSSVFVSLSADVPIINPIPDDTLNCQTTLITLSGNIPAPTGFFFQWCPLDEDGTPIVAACQETIDFEVSDPGQYQFYVRNEASGCDNTWTVTISQDTLSPTVDAGLNDTLNCNQNSLIINGVATSPNNNFDVIWTADSGQIIDNSNALQATIYEAGTYLLSITDSQNHCTASDSLLITVDMNLPIVNAGNDTLLNCLITQITLEGSGSTSSGDLSFLWTTTGNIVSGDSTATPIIDEAGFYYLTILDEQTGCSDTDTLFVQTSFEIPTAAIVNLGNLLLDCIEDTVLIDGSPSTSTIGSALLFEWQNLSSGSLWPDLSADTVWTEDASDYRLIVTDASNFCADSLDFTISGDFDTPPINFEPPLALTCDRTTVIIDASATDTVGMNIFWSDSDDIILSEDSLLLTVNESDIYILNVVNTNNGCSNAVDIFVDSDTQVPTAIIAQVTQTLDCQSPEIMLDGSNSSNGNLYEYSWTANPGLINAGQDSLVATIGSAGTYTFTVLNIENGCRDSASIAITADTAPITGVFTTITNPNCHSTGGGSFSIDSVVGGTAPFLFSFDGNSFSNTSFYSDILPGQYSLLIIDTNGCDWEETISILAEEAFILDLGPDIELTLGDSIRLEALVNRPYDTLYWTPSADFEDPSSPVQFLQPQTTTAYTVFVINENGCTASDLILINLVKPRSYFIPNIFSPANADGNNDIFMIFGGPEVKEILTFQIYDRWGNQVLAHKNFQPNNPAFGWDGTLNGRLMNAAVFAYYAEIEFIDGWVEKVKGDFVLMR